MNEISVEIDLARDSECFPLWAGGSQTRHVPTRMARVDAFVPVPCSCNRREERRHPGKAPLHCASSTRWIFHFRRSHICRRQQEEVVSVFFATNGKEIQQRSRMTERLLTEVSPGFEYHSLADFDRNCCALAGKHPQHAALALGTKPPVRRHGCLYRHASTDNFCARHSLGVVVARQTLVASCSDRMRNEGG